MRLLYLPFICNLIPVRPLRKNHVLADVAAMKKADDGIPQTVAPVEEIQLYVRDASGNRTYVTLRELIEATNGATATRADLHISRSREGELFITSRQDGTIRMLVPDSPGAATSSSRR